MPVLLYLAQLAVPPRRIEECERVEVCRMWRMLANVLAARTHLEVTAQGGPSMGSVTAACEATMARTAMRTLPGWRGQVERLRGLMVERGSVRRWALWELGPPG